MNIGQPTDAIIAKIESRRDAWRAYFRGWRMLFWTCGVLGVAASVLAAAEKVTGISAPYFAALSSVCMALIGFTNPQRRAIAYLRAWRLLDGALLRHEAGNLGLSDLVETVERGESIIAEADEQPPGSPAAKAPSPNKLT